MYWWSNMLHGKSNVPISGSIFMKIIIVSVFFLTTLAVSAQEGDSLQSRTLEAIVVEGVKTEGDTLQNFYRSNVSATTESILSRMKGVTLIRRGAYGQEPVFRGLSGGQLNVTIDGMKIFGACTDKMDPVTIYIEPQNLQSIQALMGTNGSMFGSTIGGTLNMKLAEPVVGMGKLSGQAGIDLQSAASAFNYFSAVKVGREKSGYLVNVNYRKSNNYRAGGGDVIAYSQYEKINVSVSGKWSLAKYDTLQADALFDQGWNIGFPALPMDVGRATAGIYSLTYRRVAPWLVFHNLKAKVYHNSIDHSMDDTQREVVAMHMDMPGASKTSGAFVEGDVHIFHEHQTIMKADYFTNTLLGEMTMYPEEGSPMYMQTAPEARRQNAGLFILQKFRIDNNNKLSFSLRWDVVGDYLAPGIGRQQWEVFDPSLDNSALHFLKTFSVNYKRNISGRMTMELQSGYGERMATLNERYGFYLFNRFDGYDYLGNPELLNESSWNAEATVSYFGSKVELQVAPFYQSINNYIMGRIEDDLSTMTIGARGVKKNMNINRANLAGIDVMLLASPVPSLQWITTVKYTYGTNALAEAMPLIPPLKTVSSLRFEKKKVNVQAEWEWAAAQNHVSASFGEQQTPSYSILYIRAGVKLNSLWQFNAGVENLLDRRYREHLDWGGIPRPGRNVYVNVMYKFTRKQ